MAFLFAYSVSPEFDAPQHFRFSSLRSAVQRTKLQRQMAIANFCILQKRQTEARQNPNMNAAGLNSRLTALPNTLNISAGWLVNALTIALNTMLKTCVASVSDKPISNPNTIVTVTALPIRSSVTTGRATRPTARPRNKQMKTSTKGTLIYGSANPKA